MYAQVVVLTYQPPDIDSYTYEIPKNLEKEIKIGQLVEIPFGKRNPLGIVISLKSHPHESEDQILNQAFGSETQARRVEDDTKKIVIKEISSIVFNQPLLLTYQVELLKWMSSYYLAPMVNCIEAMLPEIPKRVAQLEGIPTARSEPNEIDLPTGTQKRALAGGKVVTGPAQSLVLVPTINQIPETLGKFPKAKNYALYHNEQI